MLKNDFELSNEFASKVLYAVRIIAIFTAKLKLQLTPRNFKWLIQYVHFVRQPNINVDGNGGSKCVNDIQVNGE